MFYRRRPGRDLLRPHASLEHETSGSRCRACSSCSGLPGADLRRRLARRRPRPRVMAGLAL